MPIEVISKIKQKNNGKFKLMDAADVEYTNDAMDGVAEGHVDNVKDAIDAMFGILNSAPVLSYVDEDGFREGEKKYWQIGEQMRLMFSFSSSASGKCNITILRNGYTYKTFSSDKGRISVDLGVATEQNNFIYTITAVDSLGRDADKTLTFNHICGGVEITSTFDAIIEKNVFTANASNTINIPVGISYAESGYPRSIMYSIKKKSGSETTIEGEYQCGTQNWSSNIPLQGVEFGNEGVYTLTLQGKVVADNDAVLLSNIITYDFAVISKNTIAVTVTESTLEGITTNDTATITFRTVTNVAALASANSMAVRCYLYLVKDSKETLIKNIRMTNITSGDTNTWNIGRISSDGTYKYELVGEPIGGASTSINIQKAISTFVVTRSDSIGGNYETANLLAYFDANDMDNADADPTVWKSKNSGDTNYYYVKLHGLNYNKNGWQIDSNDGSKMLKFTGDSYGELRHVGSSGNDAEFSPISLMNTSALGNSFEIAYRTRCVGEMDACVVSCRDESVNNYGGYSIYYDKAKISSNETSTSTPINESNDEFTHVVFVIDKNIRTLENGITNTNIENLNTVATMNIYVNGVRTKVVPIENHEQFANTAAFPAMQLILNAHMDTMINKITGYGSCEIKMMRIYNSALTAEQILGNYINSKYSISEREALINKNDSSRADIPIVRFVRNKTIKDGVSQFNKFSKDVSFKLLNSITTKKSKDPTIPTSKNSWVNCTVWYTYLDKSTGAWKTIKYPDVDVYLQGTSTLQFPIKNYKIKAFKTITEDGVEKRGKKFKFIPPNKEGQEGWLIEDNVYTLKCDFMEQSHKNNTPTAVMYEKVLDKVVEYNSGDYSPCKKSTYEDAFEDIKVMGEDGEEKTKKVRKYRDAVTGFPILLYYNENDASAPDGNAIDYNSLSSEEDGYYSNDNDVMVGTMMWNVDKSSGMLGFKPKTSAPIAITNPVSNQPVLYTDGSPVTLDCLPCISLEGVSNASIPSAASFYTLDEANRYTYKADYLEPKYNALKANGTISKSMTYDEFYTKVQAKNYSDVYTYDAYCKLDGTGIFKSVYDYIAATFEVRWAWTDEELEDGKELSDQVYKECTYGHIIKTIDWIEKTYNNRDKFRAEFNQYFDFSYCATYYLQMMTLIQVDNAGKNAMFDYWYSYDGVDAGGIRPRPYDMDTQMCLDNSGEDRINISAEINVALSPTNVTGTYANQTSASNMATDSQHKRYSDYNTPNSKFWNAFGTFFRDELARNYSNLRESYYTSEWIESEVNALTSDVIGESFYNKDAGAKYLTQTYYQQNDNGTTSIHSQMLPKLNGNRDSRFKQVVEQRLIFMDTWFQYSGGDSLNKTIDLRSDANTAGLSSVQIGISVYSPCYIQIDVGTGNDSIITAYIDTDEKYTYKGETYEGVLFTLPIMANNKDITIHGAGNIKAINHMENLVITNFNCGNAKKLTSIAITSSTALTTLTTGSNTYLRSLNLSGSKTLQGNVNLTNCENIQYVNISDTKLSSISLPEGGNLKQFIAENCGLTSVTFKNLQFLETINVKNCTGIVSYEIDNCPLINTVDTSGYVNLNKIIIANCEGVTTLNLSKTSIAEMSITNCENITNINLSGCNGTIMNNLNLSSVYGLKTLNISSSQPAGGIILYLPQYQAKYASLTSEELNKLINNGVDVYWHELQTFNAQSSSLKNIAYGIQIGLEEGVCDFGRLTKLSSLNIRTCQLITQILNINYKGNVSYLFYECRSCTKITGEVWATTSSAYCMFDACASLIDIEGLELYLDSITDASYMLARCKSVTYRITKKVLDALPNVTNLGNFLCMYDGMNTTPIALESNMLGNNVRTQSLEYFFYNCNIVSIPNGLLEPVKDTLTNLHGFCYACSKLVSAPNDLIKNCTKVTTYYEMFSDCYNFTNFFDTTLYYDIFPANSPATDTRQMFNNCSSLKAPISTGDAANGLKKMFDNLPNLQIAEVMFYNCRFITAIPEGLFSRNTKLQRICGMFKDNITITGIPAMLFNTSVTGETTHPYLTMARGLFSGCTSLTGTIGSNFFTGAYALTNIGHINALALGNGPHYYYAGGMFSNTAIIGYAYDFLSKLKNLQSVSMLFFKGRNTSSDMCPSLTGDNNDKLQYVYIGDNSYPNRIYNGIFNGLTRLRDVRYCFAGNINFVTFCDNNGKDVNSPTLFASCKSTLSNAEGLFAKCKSLSIEVPRALFQNCTALTTLRACYAHTALSGSLPDDFIKGCTALVYTNYMFFYCTQLGADDAATGISIPSNIFDSCRSKISNVAYMFAGCGFNGRIGTGKATKTVNSAGLTVYKIEKYGLLSECLQLVSAAGLFYDCEKLKGAIPEDIFFTSEATKLYMYLTNLSWMFNNCQLMVRKSTEYGIDGRNKQLIYGDDLKADEAGYLIPTNWLNKCPNLQDISYIFNHVSNPEGSNAQFSTLAVLLDDLTFSQQTRLQTVRNAFSHLKSLQGSITAIFMQNALNTLQNAACVFAYSGLKSVGGEQYNAVFEKNTSTTAKNSVLTDLTYAFYCTAENNMTGYGPSPNKFTALTGSNGMVYAQSGLKNYGDYSAQQKQNFSYWDMSDRSGYWEYNYAATL